MASVLRAAGHGAVRVDDAERALGLDRTAASQRLARWAGQGWLRRVARGLYIPVPVEASRPESWSADPLYLAHLVWAPCYFTGWTAAQHWGLTEQVFRTTVLKTSCRVRVAEQRLLEHTYLLRHVPDAERWGTAAVWMNELRVEMADPARTVIDVLDDPGLGGGIRHVADMLDAYLDEHDADRLVDYGDRLGNRTVFKRLGYLATRAGPDTAALIDACRARISRGVSLLDPTAPPRGHRVMEWNIRVNVPMEGRGE
jgi:predicted transcriptional regulator of viral defense system